MATNSRTKRKEGYLVKKGHVRHNWKTRWFVLYDEKLCYFKKKEDPEPAGQVSLLGCFIVSPCTEYIKKENVFRLTTREGIEYLIQAVNEEERDIWANTIAEIIRNLEANQRKVHAATSCSDTNSSASPPLTILSTTLQEIIDAMQDPNAGISLDNHTCKLDYMTYKLCFTGIQIVDWLLKWSFVVDREEGVRMANALLEEAYLQPTGKTSKNSFRRKGERGFRAFLDETDALYRFSALRFSSNQDVLDLDSSDDSSESDDDLARVSVGVIKGTIIKEGFLEKKGHMRHNWKTRKFILCIEPPTLYYCKPSKGNLPVGKLELESCEVKALNKDEDISNTQSGAIESRKQAQNYLILLRTRKGIKYVLKAASESDRLDWMENLQTVCEDSMMD